MNHFTKLNKNKIMMTTLASVLITLRINDDFNAVRYCILSKNLDIFNPSELAMDDYLVHSKIHFILHEFQKLSSA